MPDLVVRVHNRGYFAAFDHLDSGDAISAVDSPRFDVILHGVDFHAFLAKPGDVFVWIGRMIDADAADRQRRAFLPDDIVDRVSAQQNRKLTAGIDERAAEPEDRVVLLLQCRAIGCFYYVQNFHRSSPSMFASFRPKTGGDHRVGITSVLTLSRAIFRKSPGPPRFTPSTALTAPRSSTPRPQFRQVRSGLPGHD